MRKGFLIYEEMRTFFPIYEERRPLVIYDFAPTPFWISLHTRKIWFNFLSVYSTYSIYLSHIALGPPYVHAWVKGITSISNWDLKLHLYSHLYEEFSHSSVILMLQPEGSRRLDSRPDRRLLIFAGGGRSRGAWYVLWWKLQRACRITWNEKQKYCYFWYETYDIEA